MTWLTFDGRPVNPLDPHAIVGPSRTATVPLTFAEAKANLAAAIASSRYALETSGVNAGGVVIRTDRESQATLASALLTVTRKPETLIDWKGANGWVKIGKAEVEAISDIVSDHVQACFSKERAKLEALDACQTLDDLRNFDWTVKL